MKKILILVAALSLAGCGGFARVDANYTGSSEICVDGVKYLQFVSGASVKYNPDGTVVTC